jgi:phage tail-like protein
MTLSEIAYPLPAFYFTVSVVGLAMDRSATARPDASFSEITGLESSVTTEDVREGGQNQFVHRLPTGSTQKNIVMKRGVVTQSSPMADWAEATIGSTLASPIITQTLVVMLLGSDHTPKFSWNVRRAWPVRWDWGTLNSTRNEVLVETLEFAHSGVTRTSLF